MKTTILASALALTLGVFGASSASATCWGCDSGFGFDYGAGGEASNEGKAKGGWTSAGSVTTKKIYGGGDAVDTTGWGPRGADAYAGSHFATMGGSMALSMGRGHSGARTYEGGMVAGGGFADAYKTWGND
jgi:hypothetical protein